MEEARIVKLDTYRVVGVFDGKPIDDPVFVFYDPILKIWYGPKYGKLLGPVVIELDKLLNKL